MFWSRGEVRALFSRLAGWFRRGADHRLEEELETHLALLAEAGLARGMTPDQARQAARREFGGVEQTREAYREQSGFPSVERLLGDLRLGGRALSSRPSFTVSVVLTLALGLAVFTAIFGITESILWKPLPLPESERLVAVYAQSSSHSGRLAMLSVPEYLDWKSKNRTLERFAAWRWAEEHVLKSGRALERVRVTPVTAEFFQTLRIKPALGRDFEDGPQTDRDSPAILTYACWQRLFGTSTDLSGKLIRLENEVHPVVGVLPPSGVGIESLSEVDLFLEAQFTPAMVRDRETRALETIGRLSEGASASTARADFSRLARADGEAFPRTDAGWGTHVESLRSLITSYYRPRLLLFLGASLLVFVIACANAANLLLARAYGRRAEFALRASVGASRTSLLFGILGESAWLAALSTACGLVLAFWAVKAFQHFAALPQMEIPRVREIGVDFYAFGFAGLSALVAVVLAAVPSARMAGRVDAAEALKTAGKGLSGSGRGSRLRNAMVVAEVSLSMVLLVGAGLFVSSLLRLRQVPVGFDPHRLLTLRVSLRGSGIDGSTEKRTIPDASGLLERVRALPGVRSAEIASALPFLGVEDVGFAIDGRVEPALGLEPTAAIRAVTPGYFAALGIPVERGRAFSSGDTRASPPVVLVNRNLARHYFGQENPLGHGLRIMSIPEGGSFRTGVYEIVGIAGNSKEVGLDEVEFDAIYVPLSQSPVREAYLAVRSEPEAPDLAAALKREAAFVDPERPAYDVVPMEQIISRSLSENRLYMMLALAFASVAVLLAAAGLSGVLSYAVAERRGEIAVRMALGAESSSVLAMISEDSGRLLATGVAIGLGLALALGRLLKGTLYLAPNEHEGLIYGVSVNDPWLLLAAALLLFFLAALASYLPARRATRVDLVTALREG